METMATGQNRRHAVPRVVKGLKYGRDDANAPLENMVETVVVEDLHRRIEFAKKNPVQVGQTP
jgi:hypothetical protein